MGESHRLSAIWQVVVRPMSQVNINGVEIYFEEIGEGRPLLLLGDKGWGADFWETLLPKLAEGHRLIMPEFRGSGRSELGAAPLTVTRLMEDMAFIMESLNLKDLAIYGLGLGGKVAVRLAAEYPERIGALILTNTSQGGPEGDLYRREVLETLFQLGSDGDQAAIGEWFKQALYPNEDLKLQSDFISKAIESFPTKEIFQKQLLAEVGSDLTPLLRRLRPAVHILQGESDELIDEKTLQKFRWMIPDCHYEGLPGGHLGLFSRPDPWCHALKELLVKK